LSWTDGSHVFFKNSVIEASQTGQFALRLRRIQR